MLGIVLVSHSAKLAEGAVELVKMLAEDVPVVAAGGLEDGTLGTSFEKISAAIESVYDAQGVLVFCDMGSAIMTSEMVLENMPEKRIKIVDAPLVEGALVAAMAALGGDDLDAALIQLNAPNAFAKGLSS